MKSSVSDSVLSNCLYSCLLTKKERNTNILAAGDFWQTNMPWIFGAFRRMLINFKI